MAGIQRRLAISSAWGSQQTIKDVATVVYGEWRQWMMAQHPDVWRDKAEHWKGLEKKFCDRMAQTIQDSEAFRNRCLENDGRDEMRGHMLRWMRDEIEKVAPAILTDRLLPRYMMGER